MVADSLPLDDRVESCPEIPIQSCLLVGDKWLRSFVNPHLIMHEHLSSSLGHYFALMLGSGRASTPTEHVSQGADCVRPADLVGLRQLLGAVRAKAADIHDSKRLRERIEMLASFVEESEASANTAALRETSFALYYFLKGFDLIPDSIPEIGLLDDALLVEAAYNRNLLELRSHWAAQSRAWPEAD